MATVELTDRFCQSAKAAGGRKTDYFDTAVKGLCLRASAGGTRAFFLVYSRPGDGKRVWLKLGRYPEIALGKAREKAREARGAVGEGQDPLSEKRAQAASLSVADLVESYLAKKVASRRSRDEIARRLNKNVVPVIGRIKLSDLHRRDITRCIDAVTDRGADTEANRVFEDIRAMVRWARGRGDLDTNLVEGMAKPSEAVVRDRHLAADEIMTMWDALAEADMRESTRRIIRLCLVTAQRVGEISGMIRDELDLANRTWIIPAARSKNRREHSVPLSSLAVEIIADQLADVQALSERKGRAVPPFVFPGPGARAPVTGAAIAKAVKKAERPAGRGQTGIMGVAPWTPHDLRRTAASQMQAIGISPFIIAHVLNHVSITRATVTTSVYAQYDYGKEKREALELWADRLAGIVEGKGNVVVALGAGR